MKKLTKKEVKEAYTEWNIHITQLDNEIRRYTKDIERLCIENGKKPYCSYLENLNQLHGTKDFSKALCIFEIICNYNGQKRALKDLACATNNMNI